MYWTFLQLMWHKSNTKFRGRLCVLILTLKYGRNFAYLCLICCVLHCREMRALFTLKIWVIYIVNSVFIWRIIYFKKMIILNVLVYKTWYSNKQSGNFSRNFHTIQICFYSWFYIIQYLYNKKQNNKTTKKESLDLFC